MCNIDTIIDRIKGISKQRGITQTYLCKVIGKRATFLSEVKHGKDNIDINEINAIAKELHTTPEYLKGETDNPDAPEQNAIDESQIKVALFGGDKEVTDEMWDEVKRFVEFVAQKHAKG